MIGIDLKSVGNGGGSGHLGDSGRASKKAGDSETGAGEIKVSFGAFFVKFGTFDLNVRMKVGTIGEGGGGAGKILNLVVMMIVTI